MSKVLIVGNWKMNPPTFREAKSLFDTTAKAAQKATDISLAVAPPVLFLRDLRARYKGRKIAFCAQDVSGETSGSHTGQISVAQLQDAGVSYVIIGHSERRAVGETNDDTRKKVPLALSAKVTPIICVGELKRGNSGEHFDFIRAQLRAAFADVPSEKASRVIVAYEPVWAIGGEETMKPRDMHEMAILIRKTIVALHGEGAISVRIIYGGATTESNAYPMLKDGDVTGLLVGHVSINPQRFQALLEDVSKNI